MSKIYPTKSAKIYLNLSVFQKEQNGKKELFFFLK